MSLRVIDIRGGLPLDIRKRLDVAVVVIGIGFARAVRILDARDVEMVVIRVLRRVAVDVRDRFDGITRRIVAEGRHISGNILQAGHIAIGVIDHFDGVSVAVGQPQQTTVRIVGETACLAGRMVDDRQNFTPVPVAVGGVGPLVVRHRHFAMGAVRQRCFVGAIPRGDGGQQVVFIVRIDERTIPRGGLRRHVVAIAVREGLRKAGPLTSRGDQIAVSIVCIVNDLSVGRGCLRDMAIRVAREGKASAAGIGQCGEKTALVGGGHIVTVRIDLLQQLSVIVE